MLRAHALPEPIGATALALLPRDVMRDAAALFASDVRVRRLAAGLWASSAPSAQWPEPRWPFDADAFVEDLAWAEVGEPRPSTADDERGVVAAARAALEREGAAATLLAQLVPVQGGLWPRALVEAARCGSGGGPRRLARDLEEVLARVARGTEREDAQLALALLVHAGGGARAEVLDALRGDDAAARRVVLDALATVAAPPAALRAELVRLMADAPDWPTRMRAARALPREALPRRVHEPVALVREALEAPRASALPGCARPEEAMSGL